MCVEHAVLTRVMTEKGETSAVAAQTTRLGKLEMKKIWEILWLRALPAVEVGEAREVTSCCAPSVVLHVNMLLPSSQVPGTVVFSTLSCWHLDFLLLYLTVNLLQNEGTLFRFVKCESCSHFFVVLSEADQRVKVKDVKQAEQVTS